MKFTDIVVTRIQLSVNLDINSFFIDFLWTAQQILTICRGTSGPLLRISATSRLAYGKLHAEFIKNFYGKFAKVCGMQYNTQS